MSKVKIAWVIPWYGENIPGGAEALCRATAKHLARTGYEVEILTTCIREFQSDWGTDHHPPGVEKIDGVTIRRFRARPRDGAAFDRVNIHLMRGEKVSSALEKIYLDNIVHSDDLVAYMRTHANEYVFLPIPYMFGTTYAGSVACPDRTVLVPCLHDEAYAYMACYKEMFSLVKGALYLSPSEKKLAERLYGIAPSHGAFVGGGIDTDFESNAGRFREKHGSAPFLLYAGRKDEGKNVPLLIDCFSAYKRTHGGELKLLLIGGGHITIPRSRFNRDIFDLGFVSRQEKYDAYAAAIALCQPSIMESFSIVTLEGWAAGCPALVHRDCEVTKEHCEASQGGLYFRGASEFATCVDFFLANPDTRTRMGNNGAEYVRRNYAWGPVVERYAHALRAMGFEIG